MLTAPHIRILNVTISYKHITHMGAIVDVFGSYDLYKDQHALASLVISLQDAGVDELPRSFRFQRYNLSSQNSLIVERFDSNAPESSVRARQRRLHTLQRANNEENERDQVLYINKLLYLQCKRTNRLREARELGDDVAVAREKKLQQKELNKHIKEMRRQHPNMFPVRDAREQRQRQMQKRQRRLERQKRLEDGMEVETESESSTSDEEEVAEKSAHENAEENEEKTAEVDDGEEEEEQEEEEEEELPKPSPPKRAPTTRRGRKAAPAKPKSPTIAAVKRSANARKSTEAAAVKTATAVANAAAVIASATAALATTAKTMRRGKQRSNGAAVKAIAAADATITAPTTRSTRSEGKLKLLLKKEDQAPIREPLKIHLRRSSIKPDALSESHRRAMAWLVNPDHTFLQEERRIMELPRLANLVSQMQFRLSSVMQMGNVVPVPQTQTQTAEPVPQADAAKQQTADKQTSEEGAKKNVMPAKRRKRRRRTPARTTQAKRAKRKNGAAAADVSDAPTADDIKDETPEASQSQTALRKRKRAAPTRLTQAVEYAGDADDDDGGTDEEDLDLEPDFDDEDEEYLPQTERIVRRRVVEPRSGARQKATFANNNVCVVALQLPATEESTPVAGKTLPQRREKPIEVSNEMAAAASSLTLLANTAATTAPIAPLVRTDNAAEADDVPSTSHGNASQLAAPVTPVASSASTSPPTSTATTTGSQEASPMSSMLNFEATPTVPAYLLNGESLDEPTPAPTTSRSQVVVIVSAAAAAAVHGVQAGQQAAIVSVAPPYSLALNPAPSMQSTSASTSDHEVSSTQETLYETSQRNLTLSQAQQAQQAQRNSNPSQAHHESRPDVAAMLVQNNQVDTTHHLPESSYSTRRRARKMSTHGDSTPGDGDGDDDAGQGPSSPSKHRKTFSTECTGNAAYVEMPSNPNSSGLSPSTTTMNDDATIADRSGARQTRSAATTSAAAAAAAAAVVVQQQQLRRDLNYRLSQLNVNIAEGRGPIVNDRELTEEEEDRLLRGELDSDEDDGIDLDGDDESDEVEQDHHQQLLAQSQSQLLHQSQQNERPHGDLKFSISIPMGRLVRSNGPSTSQAATRRACASTVLDGIIARAVERSDASNADERSDSRIQSGELLSTNGAPQSLEQHQQHPGQEQEDQLQQRTYSKSNVAQKVFVPPDIEGCIDSDTSGPSLKRHKRTLKTPRRSLVAARAANADGPTTSAAAAAASATAATAALTGAAGSAAATAAVGDVGTDEASIGGASATDSATTTTVSIVRKPRK